jgi:hypothetical protein
VAGMLMAIGSFPSVRQVCGAFDNADHRCPVKESAWPGNFAGKLPTPPQRILRISPVSR